MTENEGKTQTRLFLLIFTLFAFIVALVFSTLFAITLPATRNNIETITQTRREIVYDRFLTKMEINDILAKDRELYFNALGFYTNLTKNNEIAVAIVDAALTQGVPVNMAFAISYTESRFNPEAVNVNVNETIDNGLFQINDFYHPDVNPFDIIEASHYAMEYLLVQYEKFYSWDIAGMLYNAGVVDNIADHSLRYMVEFTEKEKEFDEQFNSFRRSLINSEFQSQR